VVEFSNADEWIVTESNVRYEVLAKNCERLGIDVEPLREMLAGSNVVLYPRLKDLVDMRNKIAHGEAIEPVSSEKWEELQSFVGLLMNAVQLVLYDALCEECHLAPHARAG
jgi:hypothetical protein